MASRNLSEYEISVLKEQGCSADDWQSIFVQSKFDPERFSDVHFSGEMHLGVFDSSIELPGGLSRLTGVYNSSLHNCVLEDNVYISNVGTLANYTVNQHALIENVDTLLVDGESTFGNGVIVDVLNEAGGREFMIYDELSAQIAYLLVFFRHRPQFISRLEEMIEGYVRSKSSTMGSIGSESVIKNCNTIRNMHIGPCARVQGVQLLDNGTIRSSKADPVEVGQHVIAKNFIVQEGSRITDRALIESCFIGQAVHIGKQYSAEHCLFFANSDAFHGEGVALFAGPYTVTHHKSSLLIAGYVSFFNTGSGTNQSNHMYKLGPVHQGVLERGSKTGSFAYLLWPSHIGAYSVVLGKHYINLDTSALPFSYLDEEDGKCVVTPAMNLFTVGTYRDSRKWPNRDRRKCDRKFDLIHFPLLNPYIIGRVLKAQEILGDLYSSASKEKEYVQYNGALIKRLLLKMAGKYYEMAVKMYLGDVLLQNMEPHIREIPSFQELKTTMKPGVTLDSDWLDLAGMLVPKKYMDMLLTSTEESDINDIETVSASLKQIYDHYGEFEWSWSVPLLEQRFSKGFDELTVDDFLAVIDDWQTNKLKFNNMVLKDAGKEFDASTRISYGLAGGEEAQQVEFEAVRGTEEDNDFIRGVKEESEQVKQRAAEVLERLEQLGE